MDPLFREQMQALANMQGDCSKSPVVSELKYCAVVEHLQHPEDKVDPHFKSWVKGRQFQLMDLPEMDLQQALVIPNNRKDKDEGSPAFLRVLHTAELCDAIYSIHADVLKHAGYKKVLEYAQRYYFGATRGFVQEFCRQCPVCQPGVAHQISRLPLSVLPASRPLIEHDFLSRVQIDIIDMRHCKDGDFAYIGHFQDDFTKFNVLFPLKTSAADEVAAMLEERVLAYFGPPTIFNSDGGREFVKLLTRATFERWGGNVTLVNGIISHLQDERRTGTVADRLIAMKDEEGLEDAFPWVSWLPRVMWALNCEPHDMMVISPYHLAFCRQPPTGILPGVEPDCVDEEDVAMSSENVGTPTESLPPLTSSMSPLNGNDDEQEYATEQPTSPTTCDVKPTAEELTAMASNALSSTSTAQQSSATPSSQSPTLALETVISTSKPSKLQGVMRKRLLDSRYTSAARTNNRRKKRKRKSPGKVGAGGLTRNIAPRIDSDLLRLSSAMAATHAEKVISDFLATQYDDQLGDKLRSEDLVSHTGLANQKPDMVLPSGESLG